MVVSDEKRIRIADSFVRAALRHGAAPSVFLVTESMGQRWLESPESFGSLKGFVRHAAVMVVLLSDDHSFSEFRKKIVSLSKTFPIRIATLPGISEHELVQYVDANPLEMEDTGLEIARLIMKGSVIAVTTQMGTDLEVRLSRNGEPVPIDVSSGILDNPSSWGNLPAGEVYIAPLPGTVDGRLVVDGAIPRHRLKSPIEMQVEKGTVLPDSLVSKDKVALRLLRKYFTYTYGKAIAEVGMGLNNKVRNVTGIAYIDEKIRGSVHVALGDNSTFGGTL